ncbi:hypothetical protein BJ166DRAFT_500102 [Pestalotiopsis sp. NC0098]|nr:hypothetical protein BJ166DRAFT_500102 [Pestalotiopsis sp. NC0098]
MDPLSALSIASAVVAFVDLGSNLLSASRRVYKKASGETREEASLQHVANDLAVFSQAIEHELSALQNSQSTSATGKALGQICRECVEAQQELVIAIGKVQASSPKDLDSERNQRKEKKAQSEDRLNTPAESPKHKTIIDDIWLAEWPAAPYPEIDRRDETSVLNAIIRTLKFRGDTHRSEAIPAAYEKTFEWIFAKSPASAHDKPLWPDFIEWAESSSQEVYWITGKPGAGKSTLMKHLATHPNTSAALGSWANPRPLLLAWFYFWNSGTSLQKSEIGMFRTLLWQCLSGMPTIAPMICPRRWALYKVFGLQAFDAAPEWTWPEIMESFALMLPLIGDQFNLALFIDGLDEFAGTHEKLIRFVELFRAQPGAKICVSSRPWNVFLDSFSCSPSLRMEDLTENDIQRFVEGKLILKKGFRELEQIHPQDARKLVTDLVTKAQGVFLWVSVVVNTLCEGLTEGDKLSDLQAELERLPSDLEQLYSSIWIGVKPKYKSHSSQLFQILECSTQPLDALTLWLADDDKALQRDINRMTDDQQSYAKRTMKRRLNSRTRGLLEVTRDGQVDYLHRSVRDWTSEMWREIQSAAPDFDPHLPILKALTVKIAHTETWLNSIGSFPNLFWEHTLVCLYHASQVRDDLNQVDSFVQIMDRLDSDLSKMSTSHTLLDGRLAPLYRDTQSGVMMLSADGGFPHWATTQRIHSSRDCLEVNFLGLAAQFAMLPYVKYKVLRDPKILETEYFEITILECAIFGFKEFCRPDVAVLADHYLRSSTDIRLNLVEFLLDQGALQGAKPRPKGSRTRELRKEIQRLAGKKAALLASVRNADPEEAQYWHCVLERLERSSTERVPPLEKRSGKNDQRSTVAREGSGLSLVASIQNLQHSVLRSYTGDTGFRTGTLAFRNRSRGLILRVAWLMS